MALNPDQTRSLARQGDLFSATSWTVVIAAQSQSPEAARAMETLCNKYWYPVYTYVRRRGHGPQDAEDLTQGFFYEVINSKRLRSADRRKGKFRAYLLAGVNGFLANHWHFAHAAKRGGGKVILSLDAETAEGRFRIEPACHDSPEKAFEQQWAQAVLSQVYQTLEEEFAAPGKSSHFNELKSFLREAGDRADHEAVAQRLGMTENALTVAIHRLRQKFRKLIRDEIARTVGSAEEVEPEMRHLFTVLAEG